MGNKNSTEKNASYKKLYRISNSKDGSSYYVSKESANILSAGGKNYEGFKGQDIAKIRDKAKTVIKSYEDKIKDAKKANNTKEINSLLEKKYDDEELKDPEFPPNYASIAPGIFECRSDGNNSVKGGTAITNKRIDLVELLELNDSLLSDLSESGKLRERVLCIRASKIVESLNAMQLFKTPVNVAFVVDETGKNFEYSKNCDEKKFYEYFKQETPIQGKIGNCYLIGAIIALVRNKKALKQVIPIDNADPENIKLGFYHFNFWYCGKWTDVVVDEFLPATKSSTLIFCHSKVRYEFWQSLLEKAYMKLLDSYEAGWGGEIETALEVLTGGIYDRYGMCQKDHNEGRQLAEHELTKIIKFALKRGFAIETTIVYHDLDDETKIRQIGEYLKKESNKDLVPGHCYLITNIKEEKVDKVVKIYKVEIYNPYNNDKRIKEIELNDLRNYFRHVVVYNFFPCDEINALDVSSFEITPEMKQLSTIFRQWKVEQFLINDFQNGLSEFFEIKVKEKAKVILAFSTEPFLKDEDSIPTYLYYKSKENVFYLQRGALKHIDFDPESKPFQLKFQLKIHKSDIQNMSTKLSKILIRFFYEANKGIELKKK